VTGNRISAKALTALIGQSVWVYVRYLPVRYRP